MADESGDTSAAALYRDVILEHARNPRHAQPVADPTLRTRASNPLCGDELELTLALQGSAISAIGIQVRGCAIAQASASLMSEAVVGRTLAEAQTLREHFGRLMEGEAGALPAALEPSRVLEAVRQHRSRITCTLLAWQALDAALAAGAER